MFQLLLLIIVANSSPVIAQNLLGDRWQQSVDGGLRLGDGRPLLGSSKTWRGVVAALVACAIAAPLIGFTTSTGLLTAALAMSGDVLASFIKRRLGYEPSSQSVILDSVPEALLPALFLMDTFGLSWLEVIGVVALFSATVRLTSPFLYRLGIRKRPW